MLSVDFPAGLPDMDVLGFVGFDLDFNATMTCGAGVGTDGAPPTKLADGGLEEEEETRRRLRRKISNRESARRSRARMRQRAEGLERAAEALRAERRALTARLGAASSRARAVRCGNARLQAEACALWRRLREAALLLALARSGAGVVAGRVAQPAAVAVPQQLALLADDDFVAYAVEGWQ